MRRIAVLLLAGLLIAACSSEPPAGDGGGVAAGAESVGASAGAAEGPTEAPTEAPTEGPTNAPSEAPTPEPVDPADVGANELGHVPVLMYHGLVEEPADDWQITPEEFREELELLHAHGYFPVTAAELARGELDVPAGRSPVVLTFDDTLPSQFDYDAEGNVDPDSAVGVLLEFADAKGGFPVAGSFYVTDKRFDRVEDGQEMFADLAELGFEVGNHTIGHGNLGAVDPDEARRQLALGAEQIREVVPGADVATLSLPLGRWPDDREIAYAGTHGGVAYEHEGVLLVGAEPAPSPFAAEFEPLAIPRIRSMPDWDGETADYGSGFWLDWLEADPDRKYVSDGDPTRISFPSELAEDLDPEHAEDANPYDR